MQETNLYTVSIPPIIKALTAFKGVLAKAEAKAEAHAESKKLSWMAFEDALLNERLVFNQ